MQAQRKWQDGDTRFVVETCPATDAEKLKADDPDAWPGDHCTKNYVFSDFRSAEAFACKAVKSDWFGCCNVSSEVCESAKYDWWDNTGNWSVVHDTKPGDLDPEKPDYTD